MALVVAAVGAEELVQAAGQGYGPARANWVVGGEKGNSHGEGRAGGGDSGGRKGNRRFSALGFCLAAGAEGRVAIVLAEPITVSIDYRGRIP